MLDPHHKWNLSFTPTIIGFLTSLILTLAGYYFVIHHTFQGLTLALTILGTGTLQALLQIIFFLQLGMEAKPRWNLIVFLFMLLVLIVFVGGTFWIMHNLSYNLTMRKIIQP